MPAVSKSQQRLFGMVHALQKGTLSKSKVSPQLRRMAKTIDPESVSHFAETRHSKLPEHKKKKDKDNENTKNAMYKAAATAILRHTLRRLIYETNVRNRK